MFNNFDWPAFHDRSELNFWALDLVFSCGLIEWICVPESTVGTFHVYGYTKFENSSQYLGMILQQFTVRSKILRFKVTNISAKLQSAQKQWELDWRRGLIGMVYSG